MFPIKESNIKMVIKMILYNLLVTVLAGIMCFVTFYFSKNDTVTFLVVSTATVIAWGAATSKLTMASSGLYWQGYPLWERGEEEYPANSAISMASAAAGIMAFSSYHFNTPHNSSGLTFLAIFTVFAFSAELVSEKIKIKFWKIFLWIVVLGCADYGMFYFIISYFTK